MSVGARLREERLRLGLSQPAFAALAGATKGAQAKWERDAASPNAVALIAFAEAGADVLYILTGRRTGDREETATTQIEDQLAGIRRDMLDASRHRLPGEDAEQAEKRTLERNANALAAILLYDQAFLTPELREEVERLQAIIISPVQLAAFRAADYVQMHRKRRKMKAGLSEYLVGGSYAAGEATLNILTTMAIDYCVPQKLIAELYHEISEDVADQVIKSGAE